MIKEAIQKLVVSSDLTTEESVAVMTEIMEGQATEAQIAAFMVALRLKGETVEEITGCARVMREKATRIDAGDGPVADTCGTGGDGSSTFNISTAAAFVAAGAGLKIAKHGNRSVSSQSGSADVLKALGVNIEADQSTVERCLAEANIGFLFAPMLHGAMKYAIGPRREIGIRTVFNILGPLTNPAGATCQVLGVYDGALTESMARVLGNLGSERAFVVHGSDGLDEITTTGPTKVSELKDGEVHTYEVRPDNFGLPQATIEDLAVVTPDESAAAITGVLSGEQGPKRDIVVLNAAAALAAAGIAPDLAGGLPIAANSIDSGPASQVLAKLVETSNA